MTLAHYTFDLPDGSHLSRELATKLVAVFALPPGRAKVAAFNELNDYLETQLTCSAQLRPATRIDQADYCEELAVVAHPEDYEFYCAMHVAGDDRD